MNLKCPWDVVGSRLGTLPHATIRYPWNNPLQCGHRPCYPCYPCLEERTLCFHLQRSQVPELGQGRKMSQERVPYESHLVSYWNPTHSSYSFISWYQLCLSRNIIICSGLNNCCGKRGAWWCVNAMEEGEERSPYHFLAAQCCSKTFPSS